MKKPDDIPEGVRLLANVAWHDLVSASGREAEEEVMARAILAERERCRAVANERAAQLYAVLELPGTDEAKAGWAGQMIEALMIEQRIASGHQPKDSINIEGLHAVAKENGFPL